MSLASHLLLSQQEVLLLELSNHLFPLSVNGGAVLAFVESLVPVETIETIVVETISAQIYSLGILGCEVPETLLLCDLKSIL